MNIAGMQRRIACQGDFSNRRNNPYDPVAHPSLFFRRDGQSSKNTSILAFKRKVLRRDRKEKRY
jgi:hypothetical protein